MLLRINRKRLALVWNIECLECGVWETIHHTDSEINAFRIASKIVQKSVREEWVRIVTPDCKIL